MRSVSRLSLFGLLALGCGASACIVFSNPAEVMPAGDGGSVLSIAYPSRDVYAILSTTAVSLVPDVDGTPSAFSISPALPSGLVLNSESGIIAGVPGTVADDVEYTVTAAGDVGSVQDSFRLTVLAGYAVNSSLDGPDDDGGADTSCFSTAASGCSLRAAVQTANGQAGKQLILLQSQTHTLASALPNLDSDLVLAGMGATSSVIAPAAANPGHRFAEVTGTPTLKLAGVSVNDFGPANGAVLAGYSASAIVVKNSRFDGNRGGDGGVFDLGLGATLTVDGAHFENNGTGNWGGVVNLGSGSSADIQNCYATRNEGTWGSFSHIYAGAIMSITNCTLYDNVNYNSGTLASPEGTYHIRNVTLVGNSSTNPTGPAGYYFFTDLVTYFSANSILADNRDGNGAENNCHKNNVAAVLNSLGGHIISDAAGNCAAELTGPNDQLATNPLLVGAAPADNGGATLTWLPQAGSPALDGGVNSECAAKDQRGEPRPADALGGGPLCDAGAVEAQP
ncbi:MAG: putative Ig domain-containing protein [Bdellovibrionales bacterium]|nr:putative Ig domain-containing protein [Bdellovibrionales bacterium]